jgi:DNA-binding HxlR family transcriptional regulator
MVTKRTYGDGCGIAHALDLVGERWALLVVRELLLGPKRFTDLRAGLPNASPNVLAGRLRELMDARVVTQRKLPPPAASQVYELTSYGRELEPIVLALGRWGLRSPDIDELAAVSADSAMLALLTSTAGHDLGDTPTVQISFGQATFAVRVVAGTVEVTRGPVERPAAELVTDPRTFLSLLGGDLSLTEADASVSGRADVLERLLHALRVPTAA